ncbi:hypothetical protein A3C87_03045 [Candidatus Kaiserbacteria bacterium RIFCSPHIGHO2_02_FULL_49_34]|uniref:Pirin domain-containing protein n=1 Tax=Candidatus Kaiserbacteria bacterium RIFCSPHIGHO2_02_FULL_49_34 TaxID=1798491 RepID=A0A1F6DJA2_9BACT|nr:MAG: hypothetical protein A3C87_03045 [Candidatus Kaiserbacteria bacterium RIFCSPHIGHO2_02_FULL_49_34]
MQQKTQLTIHRADNRGVGEHDWLSTRFSFSFAHWYEPTRMGFGALRVLNDDTIKAGSGFGAHSHENMEIITIVTKGVLTHKDSMGNIGTLPSGEVQVMSAGAGVWHSEYNDGDDDLQLFQIWITPRIRNIEPHYNQQSFLQSEPGEKLLVAPTEHEGVLTINQDAYISRIVMNKGHSSTYVVKKPGNGVYFFVMSGEVTIADTALSSRDALGVEYLQSIPLMANDRTEVLAIEIPMQ